MKKFKARRNPAVDAYDRAQNAKLPRGILLSADNQIDTTTGTDRLKAVFENKDNALFPNQFVNASLLMETLARGDCDAFRRRTAQPQGDVSST